MPNEEKTQSSDGKASRISSGCVNSNVGKYVCYNSVDGGACWGRIKAECKVNTMGGEKEAFILEDRVVAHLTATLGVTAKVFSAGSTNSRTMATNPFNGQLSDEVEVSVTHVKGDTLIRKDVIDLAKDVIDLDDFWGKVPEDKLFVALIQGREGPFFQNKALEIGLNKLLGSDFGLKERVKQELKARMEKRANEQEERQD